MSRKATGVEICAILMILIGLMYLITGINGVIFSYINGYDTRAFLLGLLFPIFLIVVGWELTNLEYWAWLSTITLIAIWIFKTAYDMVIFGAWIDILWVATLTIILMYFLAAKTRSQLTRR